MHNMEVVANMAGALSILALAAVAVSALLDRIKRGPE